MGRTKESVGSPGCGVSRLSRGATTSIVEGAPVVPQAGGPMTEYGTVTQYVAFLDASGHAWR